MSTKPSSKFWKKFGLGKKTSSTQENNRPLSIHSQATPSFNKDDSQSIKNKRFSGVFPNRKQSTHSINRLHQLGTVTTTTTQDTNCTPPPLPSGSTTDMDLKQAPNTTPPSSQTTLGKESYQANHVQSSTPPSDTDLGKQHDDIELAFDVITHDEADEFKQSTKQVDLLEIKSCNNTETSPTPLLISNTCQTITPMKKVPSSQVIKSRLRQPSGSTSITSSSSSSSLLQKDTTRQPHLTLDQKKDQQIQQLQEALQTEQSINRALQGQKEAITRDLDYFSLTVDELLEEKETLVQKYEEEKLKSQTKEEDLNVLLDKLKTSTDNARDRSMEVDHWKTQVEVIKEEALLEQKDLKAAMKRKDQEIARLKNNLANSKEEIKSLSTRLDQLVQESNQPHEPRSPSHYHQLIETPSASPRLDAQRYHDNSHPTTFPLDGTTQSHGQLQKRSHPSTTPPPLSALDNELHMLTKEKEKLQSDYGKIPLSGGGHSARRRQEKLEEMLDEVDSQLSKVKQKIRRS
ncbi:hypothetical protein BC941DRAFT_408880 [Chlamydoabsidia padenii]|nr:hypothetical protein BC941DRAFT_408880 [Chlamydoabsidia padenii]